MSDEGGEDRDADRQSVVRRPRVVRVLEIVNKKGLHARASAKFVQTVEKFDAAVKVTRGHETVGGTSIMGLMMLGAAHRHHASPSRPPATRPARSSMRWTSS